MTQPCISSARCFSWRLPAGVSFTGRAGSDARLLALAADFDAKTQARREPKLTPTVVVP
ncbi:MAG TPA: hypothetical protein VGA56_01455 [Opitutaceae bacterium]